MLRHTWMFIDCMNQNTSQNSNSTFSLKKFKFLGFHAVVLEKLLYASPDDGDA